MSDPAIFMFSKSADLLRKSLLSHIWRVPGSNASCKHERLFDTGIIRCVKFIIWIVIHMEEIT